MRTRNVAALAAVMVAASGCATITSDSHQPVAFKAPGCAKQALTCTARNKRGSWDFAAPATVQIRRSDDQLHIDCEGPGGFRHKESVPSRIGAKIVASAVMLDFGIVDSITDKHREYPPQIVMQACAG